MSEDTEILRKERPLVFAALSFILKRLEAIVIAGVISGVSAWFNYQHEHKDVNWIADDLQKHTQRMNHVESNIVITSNILEVQQYQKPNETK